MDPSSALKAYFKTPLAIISLVASLVAGGIVGTISSASGLAFLLGLGGGAVFWAGFSLAALRTGTGAKAVLAQTEREDDARTLASIKETQAFLSKVEVLRLPDAEVAGAQAYLVQSAGEYISACKKALSRSPQADALIADSLDTLDLYLKELDESSTERRFGLADAEAFADARARVVRALKENARLIRSERLLLDGGLSPADRMAIKEELKS